MNLKHQVVENLVQGLKRPFWKLPHRSGVLACRFDPLNKGRGVINGKAGKAAALPKFLDALTLSQSGAADYAQPLALPYLKNRDYAPGVNLLSYEYIRHLVET